MFKVYYNSTAQYKTTKIQREKKLSTVSFPKARDNDLDFLYISLTIDFYFYLLKYLGQQLICILLVFWFLCPVGFIIGSLVLFTFVFHNCQIAAVVPLAIGHKWLLTRNFRYSYSYRYTLPTPLHDNENTATFIV